MRNPVTFFAALSMLCSTVATAQDASSAGAPEGAKKNLLQGSLGLGSPVGELGVSYAYAPIRQAEIEIGAGVGFSGYQLSLMPKLALGVGGDRFVLGVGPSASIDSGSAPKREYIAYWLNAEIGYEHRTPSGLSVLVAVGIGYGIGGETHRQCEDDCGGSDGIAAKVGGRMYPQGRIAFGRWF
jgi:hypothetical protein